MIIEIDIHKPFVEVNGTTTERPIADMLINGIQTLIPDLFKQVVEGENTFKIQIGRRDDDHNLV